MLYTERRLRPATALVAACLLVVLAGGIGIAEKSSGAKGESQFVDRHGLLLSEATIARHEGQLERRGLTASSGRFPLTDDRGSVAVLQDDGTIITPPNVFDLGGKSITFVPDGTGYRVTAGSGEFDDGAGGSRTVTLSDDDTSPVTLGFPFTFFGRIHTSFFLNTDGNITFTAGDSESTARDLTRLVGGAPRIAPLLSDLNPLSPARISTELLSDRMLVTWTNVGEFTDSGSRGQNTFQIVLNSNGTFRFNYRTMQVLDAVVGVSPGATASAPISVVDYANLTAAGTFAGSVAEVFADSADVDVTLVAKAFYESHTDSYDGLILFNDFDISLDDAFAFALPLRNSIQGIIRGRRSTYDLGRAFGSPNRLQVFIQMGALSNYPSNPQQRFLGENNTLSILGQEFGHRWLAFLDVNPPALLGRDSSHWSFVFNTSGSVLEGNEIEDRGSGNFRTVGAVNKYGPLDQYVMGLRSAAEVPPTFVITNPAVSPSSTISSSCRSAANLPSCGPRVGVDLTGTRRDITIDDIVSAMGPRVPSAENSPKDFRVAFILLTERGKAPRSTSVQIVDSIRAQWETFFNQAVEGRGTMSSNLLYFPPQVTSIVPTSGPISGSTAITVRGSGFQTDSVVEIGGRAAPTTFRSSSQLEAIAVPSPAAGTMTVRVRNPRDGQTGNAPAGFTYVAPTVTELQIALPANGSRRVESLGASPTAQTGFASLDGGFGVAVFKSYNGTDLISEAAVLASATSSTFTLYAERGPAVSTGIAVANPGTLAATITLRTSSGLQELLTLPAGGQRASFIHELFPSIGTSFLGTLTIQSSTPVALTALRGTVNAANQFLMTTIPVSAGALPAGVVAFPQFADGGGYASEIILVNPTGSSLAGNLTFSASVSSNRGTASTFSYDVPPSGVWKLRTSGNTAALQTGFATLTPSTGRAPAATAVLAYSIDGVLKSEAGVAAQTALSRATLFGVRNGSRRSVAAIVNRDSRNADIRMTAFNPDGSIALNTRTVTVNAGGYRAAFFDELLPELPEGFEGTVALDSTVPVYIVTLRGGTNAAGEFLMTAMPVVDPAMQPGPVYFPQLADGGGFSTEFLLLPASSPYRLRFFAGNGQPAALSLK